MNMRLAFTGLILLLSSTITLAGDNPLLGTWKLKSVAHDIIATGKRFTNSVNIRMAISATQQTVACMRLVRRIIA